MSVPELFSSKRVGMNIGSWQSTPLVQRLPASASRSI